MALEVMHRADPDMPVHVAWAYVVRGFRRQPPPFENLEEYEARCGGASGGGGGTHCQHGQKTAKLLTSTCNTEDAES